MCGEISEPNRTAIVRPIDASRRRISAVMFTDIVGFTGLMQNNERETIQKLESHQQQLKVLHDKFGGRIVQYYGDGSLSLFESPLQAVHCAIAIQANMRRLELPLKIGIHLGQVVEKGNAVYGDAVNMASRIESVGIADSILFSTGIWNAIKTAGFSAKSLGALHFKHANRAIRVFALADKNLAMPHKNRLEGKFASKKSSWSQSILMTVIGILILALGLLTWRTLHLNAQLTDKNITASIGSSDRLVNSTYMESDHTIVEHSAN